MFIDAVQRLYDYQRESNKHVLDVAERLTKKEFTSVVVEGQPSVRETLFHLVEVIEIHFAWWNYSADRKTPNVFKRSPQDFANVKSLRDYWSIVDSNVVQCVGSLTKDSQLDRPFVRAFPDGSQNERVLWKMMLHVINHGTQHRSEVAMMLTKLGHSPGDMEIL